MGWDYEDAEAEFWASNHVVNEDLIRERNARRDRAERAGKAQGAEFIANVERAKRMGYTDTEIMAMSRWPWEGDVWPAHVHHRDESLIERAAQLKVSKDSKMISKARTIKNLKAAIEEAQKELALLERIPAEPGEKITTFTVTFPSSRKPYVYVGLRVDGEWKMSGKHFEGSNWTWQGIFNRFEEIHATVSYISTPTEYRHEQVR